TSPVISRALPRPAAALRCPSSTAIRCRSACATARPGCCSLTFERGLPIEPPQPVAARRALLGAGAPAAAFQLLIFGDAKLEADRPVVGRPESERIGSAAGQPMDKAAVEAKWHDIAGKVRRLAWPDVGEARQHDRPHHVEVADDRRGLATQG